MENLIRFNVTFNELQLLAALGNALGITAGVINAVALVAVFGSLVGAIISAMGERNTGGIKNIHRSDRQMWMRHRKPFWMAYQRLHIVAACQRLLSNTLTNPAICPKQCNLHTSAPF